MSFNPYEASAPSTNPFAIHVDDRRGRPTGITVLVILNVLGALAMIIGLMGLAVVLGPTLTRGSSLSARGMLLLLTPMITAYLAIASAFGMWIGKRWGWWHASILYAYMLLLHSVGVYDQLTLMGQLGANSGVVAVYMGKQAFRIVLYGTILAYMFRGSIRWYFQFKRPSRGVAFAIVAGAALAWVGITRIFMAIG